MWDEDPDPNGEGYVAPRVVAAPYILWEAGAVRAKAARCLVLGVRGAGALFVQKCLCEGVAGTTRVGAVVEPSPGAALPQTVEEAAEEPLSGLIYERGGVLLIAVQYHVPVERTYAWAALLFGEVAVERLVVLDIVQIHSFFNSTPDPPVPPLLFKLETPVHQDEGASRPAAAIPSLPSPNHAVDLAGALCP